MGCHKLTYQDKGRALEVNPFFVDEGLEVKGVSEKNRVRAYRYGFNGMEKDDAVAGEGNSYDFGARIYDPRLGRWLAVDPLAEKYVSHSPFSFVMNMPTIAVDPDGERVWIVINTGDSEHDAAAATRVREIKSTEGYDPEVDKVYHLQVPDLGNLKSQIGEMVNDANNNCYGKTVELAVYGHAGTDGPAAGATSGPNNLFLETGSAWDKNQMTLGGWKDINFNFDENASVAAFYGCQSAAFAQRFAAIQEATFTAGYGGRCGVSESSSEFDNNFITWPGEDLYMWDGMELFTYPRNDTKETYEGEAIDAMDVYDWRFYNEYFTGGTVPTDKTFSTNVYVIKNAEGAVTLDGHTVDE